MSLSGEQLKPVFAMVVFDVLFAIMVGLIKKALDEGMNMLVIITLRQLVATVFLAPIAYFKERKTRPKLTAEICGYLFLSALLGASLPQYTFFLGMKYTTATFASTFSNLTPVITFLVALLVRLETLNIKTKAGLAKLFGTLLSLIGAMILTLYKGIPLTHKNPQMGQTDQQVNGSNGSEKWIFGSIALLANAIAFSLWLLLQSKVTKKYPVVFSSTAFMLLLSFIQVGGLGLAIERNISVWIPKGNIQITSVIYSGIASSGIGFVIMTWSVEKKGPVFASAFIPLIQVFVALIDFSILHEPLYFGSVLGAIFLIIGLYLLLWGKKEEASISLLKLPEKNKEQENKMEASIVN
ncbi:hypothetical protein LUZ60_007369 [Juncus effusus]|nr:hypothetical protein LUZ60_007369 [Juncus effusus]